MQFAPTVAMHTEYHLLIGFTGTLIVADHETIALLVRHPAANELIQSGRCRPSPASRKAWLVVLLLLCSSGQNCGVPIRALS